MPNHLDEMIAIVLRRAVSRAGADSLDSTNLSASLLFMVASPPA